MGKHARVRTMINTGIHAGQDESVAQYEIAAMVRSWLRGKSAYMIRWDNEELRPPGSLRQENEQADVVQEVTSVAVPPSRIRALPTMFPLHILFGC